MVTLVRPHPNPLPQERGTRRTIQTFAGLGDLHAVFHGVLRSPNGTYTWTCRSGFPLPGERVRVRASFLPTESFRHWQAFSNCRRELRCPHTRSALGFPMRGAVCCRWSFGLFLLAACTHACASFAIALPTESELSRDPALTSEWADRLLATDSKGRTTAEAALVEGKARSL